MRTANFVENMYYLWKKIISVIVSLQLLLKLYLSALLLLSQIHIHLPVGVLGINKITVSGGFRNPIPEFFFRRKGLACIKGNLPVGFIILILPNHRVSSKPSMSLPVSPPTTNPVTPTNSYSCENPDCHCNEPYSPSVKTNVDSSFVMRCNCKEHSPVLTEYRALSDRKLIMFPLPARIYNHDDPEQQYHYMDTHYNNIMDYIRRYQYQNQLENHEVPSYLIVDAEDAIYVVDRDNTLEVPDLRRKYYLLVNEYENLADDILPDWISTPRKPPTNTVLIIWLASIVKALSQMLGNLAISGKILGPDEGFFQTSFHTSKIEDWIPFNNRFAYRHHDFKNPPAVFSKECTVVLGGSPYSDPHPRKEDLSNLCLECMDGFTEHYECKRNYPMVQCKVCKRVMPFGHWLGTGNNVTVNSTIVNHETLSLVKICSLNVLGDVAEPHDENGTLGDLHDLYTFMEQRAKEDERFLHRDLYHGLFYYSEENLVLQHRTYSELVSIIQRIRLAFRALGFDWRSRNQSEHYLSKYHYQNGLPTVFDYCSVTGAKYATTPTEATEFYQNVLCSCGYTHFAAELSTMAHYECHTVKQYRYYYDHLSEISGRYRRTKRAAPEPEEDESPPKKMAKSNDE